MLLQTNTITERIYSTSLAEATIDAEMYGETQANMDS